ncbi:hypothetical protein QBC35DRAFT_143875 [Podospora australis]|uniref:Extracellular membrane protein CFEM domain-containing protein n=1 Tax=Podospora australis TaxID=1536484 RepID=A0AAN6WII7_9PEZI|nr:hypothetical protein QBC35DRAFT_143875 [Podospora australis]
MASKRSRSGLIAPIILITLASLASGKPQTIGSYPGFSTQRQCAKTCFFTAFQGSVAIDTLGAAIGCLGTNANMYTQLVPEECYCRADLRDLAHQALESCIVPIESGLSFSSSDACTGDATKDLEVAKNIYDGYCATVRGAITGGSSSTGGNSNSGPTGGSSNNGGGGTAGVSNDSQPKSEEKNGLSMSDIIGIAIGVPSFLATMAGIFWGVRWKRNQKKHKYEAAQHEMERPPPPPYAQSQPHIQIINNSQGNFNSQGHYRSEGNWR